MRTAFLESPNGRCIQRKNKQLDGRASQCELSLHGYGKRGQKRNNTGNNNLAVVHRQLTQNLLIEILPAFDSLVRLPVSGTLLQIPTRMNENDWNLTL
jgi:hypothetical protein